MEIDLACSLTCSVIWSVSMELLKLETFACQLSTDHVSLLQLAEVPCTSHATQ